MTFMYNNKETATSTLDCLDKWKDNMVTAGWTLYDDQSADTYPYYIMSSSGENSDQMTCYVRLGTVATADRLQHFMYLDWNATTHVGVVSIGHTSYSYILTDDDASFDMWMCANGDGYTLITYVSSGYHISHVGIVSPFHEELGELDTAITSGSSVALSLGSGEAAGFEVGKQYQIVGAAGEGRDPINLSAVDESTDTLTAQSIARSYGVGSKVGFMPFRWYSNHSRNTSAQCFIVQNTGVGTANDSGYCGLAYAFIPQASVDPDAKISGDNNYYGLTPALFYHLTGSTGMTGLQHADSLFLRGDVSTSSGHTMSVGDIDSGTSTGSNSSTTLNDTGKSWSADQHNGKALVITVGTGSGQVRTISDTTATQLTVSAAWTTTPDATSDYVICDEAWIWFYVGGSTAYQGAMRAG